MAQSHTFRPSAGTNITNNEGNNVINVGNEISFEVGDLTFMDDGLGFLQIENALLSDSVEIGDTLTVDVAGTGMQTVVVTNVSPTITTDLTTPVPLTDILGVTVDMRTPSFAGATEEIEVIAYNDLGPTGVETNTKVVRITTADYALLDASLLTEDTLFLITA